MNSAILSQPHPVSPERPLRVDRLAGYLHRAREAHLVEKRGYVTQVIGLVIESCGPMVAVGDICRIEAAGGEKILSEVVGFRGDCVLLMPLREVHGIQPGSPVVAVGKSLRVGVGDELKGRVLNGLGEPIDELGPLRTTRSSGILNPPPNPLTRKRIQQVFETGVKSLDTFTPCGQGQRMGIFAGSGVGKSTLLGMLASHAQADVNVIALIGERGREVREFLEKDLTEEGRRKSVVIVATSDQPALVRVKGAFVAMSIAEHFRDCGKNVLLMMDSVTRFALAQREIGLAIGEPPATRGFTPSVFALLPRLLERAGSGEKGTITGLFTVLVEGDDMNDPIADAVRSILDGHIVLSRELATQNHYPAVDVLESVSRLNRDLTATSQLDLAGRARNLLALLRKNQDLINIGAYVPGSNPEIDRALVLQKGLRDFLRQNMGEGCPAAKSWELLESAMTVRSK
jgi:flagellum-specific ATP synthase